MNEKVKKIFAWIGGVLAGFFGLFVFVRTRDHRNGIADVEKRTSECGRTVEGVADGIGEVAAVIDGVKGRTESVADGVAAVAERIADSQATTDAVAGGLDGARQGIAEGIRIIEDIEKRNSH